MNSLSTFSLSKSWVEVLEIVSSLSSVSSSVVKDVQGSVPASVSCSDCLSSACSASYSTFLSSPFIIMHLSLKSPSPSSITTSEPESGSIHNMTIFLFGLILTCLHGTIACFCSISMTSCSVIWSMPWTSPSMGWLNISATLDGTPG